MITGSLVNFNIAMHAQKKNGYIMDKNYMYKQY